MKSIKNPTTNISTNVRWHRAALVLLGLYARGNGVKRELTRESVASLAKAKTQRRQRQHARETRDPQQDM